MEVNKKIIKIYNQEEISITKEALGNGAIQYSIIKSFRSSFQINTFPTMNCQSSAMASTESFLAMDNYKKLVPLIYTYCGQQRQMIMDVTNTISRILDKILPVDCIVFKQPYESTNGSSMVFYLVNFYKWKELLLEEEKNLNKINGSKQ